MSEIGHDDIDFLNACKTMAHETMHMFGIDRMNDSNNNKVYYCIFDLSDI